MQQRIFRFMTVGLCLAAVAWLGGCKKGGKSDELTRIRTAYDARQYEQAYALGANASRGNNDAAQQAAYMAGLSAYKLGRYHEAINHLAQASQSADRSMAGDALATMGLIYAQHDNHARAVDCFLRAAGRLDGQAKANAYFYAAVSQQKLGRWASARENLSLARYTSGDLTFKRQVDEQLLVTGYSLQAGAYADAGNAQRAAEALTRRSIELRIGRPRLVRQVSADGREVTAVQVGQFSSYATALIARQTLNDPSVIIVPLR